MSEVSATELLVCSAFVQMPDGCQSASTWRLLCSSLHNINQKRSSPGLSAILVLYCSLMTLMRKPLQPGWASTSISICIGRVPTGSSCQRMMSQPTLGCTREEVCRSCIMNTFVAVSAFLDKAVHLGSHFERPEASRQQLIQPSGARDLKCSLDVLLVWIIRLLQ